MWKVYQWLWLRAQKSAAKEIIAYATAHFKEPAPEWRTSKEPVLLRRYYEWTYARQSAMHFCEMIASEYDVDTKGRLNLRPHTIEVKEFEEKLK